MVILKFLRGIYILPIRLYQVTFSQLIGSGCKFTPTCSTYAIQAVRKRGIILGTLLGIGRIFRCGPWSKGGEDYLPDKFSEIKHLL